MSGAKGNWGQFKNPEVDSLLDKHLREPDEAKRAQILSQALKIVYESAELTSAYAITQAVGSKKNVHGYRSPWRTIAAGELWLS